MQHAMNTDTDTHSQSNPTKDPSNPHRPLNRLLNSTHHALRLLRIKRNHMPRPMIIKGRLGRLTESIQRHTLSVNMILVADDIRSGDINGVRIRDGLHILQA